jgi:hypothetical protein
MSQPPPIEILFVSKGLDEVQRGMRTILEVAQRVERQSKSSNRVKTTKEEAKAVSDVVTSLKNLNAAEKMVTAAARAGTTARARDFQKEADLRKKLAHQTAKEFEKITKDIERNERAAAQRRVRDFERSEKDKLRAAKRAADQASKADQGTREQRARIFTGTHSYTTDGVFGRGVKMAGGIMAGAVKGVMDVGGGFGVADSVQQEVALQGKASMLAASAPGSYNAGEIRKRAQGVASAQGMDPSEVLDAYDAIKKMTGQLDVAMDVAPDLAKISTAMGANFGEIGSLAGNLLAASPKMSKDDLTAQVRLLAAQGMVGGVEIGDFAKYGGRLTAGATLFGGDASRNQAMLGGMSQIARQYGGAASAAEATLASQRFATDVAKKSGHLEGMGIKVSDGKGKLRSAEDIAMDMLDKTGGDVTKLSALQLGERGNRVMTGLAELYREGGGGESGKNRVKAELSKYTNASLSEDEVELRNKKRQAAIDIQLNKAMLQLRTTVGTQLVPQMSKFINDVLVPNIPNVQRLFQGLSGLADIALQNPLKGAAMLIAGGIAVEIGKVGLQEMVRKTLETQLGGKAGLVIASATFAIAAATLVVDHLSQEADKRNSASYGVTAAGVNAMGEPMTEAGLREKKLAAAKIQERIADLQDNAGGSKAYYGIARVGAGLLDKFAANPADALSGKGKSQEVVDARNSQIAADNAEVARQKQQLEQLTLSIQQTEEALRKFSQTANNSKMGPADPNHPTQSGLPVGPARVRGR